MAGIARPKSDASKTSDGQRWRERHQEVTENGLAGGCHPGRALRHMPHGQVVVFPKQKGATGTSGQEV